MIIVSQDKRKIVNFDNIYYIDYYKIDGTYEIDANTDKDSIFLGYYKTEERAKEVLREIYCRYEHSQSLLSSKCITVQDFIGKDFIYEMPEE